MGQLVLRAKVRQGRATRRCALEKLVPQDIARHRARDGSATRNSPTMTGGLLDDLMVANFGDHLFLVVNAACKAEDEAHLRAHLTDVLRPS